MADQPGGGVTPGNPLNYQDQIKFLQYLIFIHMVRNEIAIAPALTDQRYASSERSLGYTLAYQRSVVMKWLSAAKMRL